MNAPATDTAQLRLWQLISPALPVGAYAYSGGLEYAVECAWVSDEDSACDWISGQARHNLATLDIPLLARLYQAWETGDSDQLGHWNAFLLASRESAELRTEDQNLGAALAQLLPSLGITAATDWQAPRQAAFATMFALGAVEWKIPLPQTAQGYLWAWVENQVAAAIKLIPLGQTAGQRILSQLVEQLPRAVAHGLMLDDNDIGAISPAVAIASAKHETQYSRLFRS